MRSLRWLLFLLGTCLLILTGGIVLARHTDQTVALLYNTYEGERNWLMIPGNSATVRVPYGSPLNYLPRALPSPDGKWLAFVSYHNFPYAEIKVIRPDGSRLHSLNTMPDMVRDLLWSMDGEWVIFAPYVSDSGLYRVHIADQTLESLTPKYSRLYDVRQVPGTDWLFYTAQLSGTASNADRAIYRVREDGRDLQRLTPASTCAIIYSVSPDARSIIYSDCAYQTLYVMNLDGSEHRELAQFTRINTLYWDSQGIIVSAVMDSHNGFYHLNLNGTQERIISSINHYSPQEYLSYAGEEWSLGNVVSDENSELVLFTPGYAKTLYLTFTSDMSEVNAQKIPGTDWIVYQANRGQTSAIYGYAVTEPDDLYRLNLKTGYREQLTDTSYSEMLIGFLPLSLFHWNPAWLVAAGAAIILTTLLSSRLSLSR